MAKLGRLISLICTYGFWWIKIFLMLLVSFVCVMWSESWGSLLTRTGLDARCYSGPVALKCYLHGEGRRDKPKVSIVPEAVCSEASLSETFCIQQLKAVEGLRLCRQLWCSCGEFSLVCSTDC